MPLILDLPSDLENALTAEAAAPIAPAGVCSSSSCHHSASRSQAATGEELLAYWQNEGLIGTRSYIADAAPRLRPCAMRPREGSDRSL